MKDPGKPASVIHLSDRRPTPKEVPAFARDPGQGEEVSAVSALRTELGVFHDGLEVLQGHLLAQLVLLAQPEVRRFAFPSIRTANHGTWKLPEALLKELETRFGTYPVRVRQEKWLDSRAFHIAGHGFPRGLWNSKLGDTGAILGQELYLLADGQLACVELVGFWKIDGEHSHATVSTIGNAELIDAQQAVQRFTLHQTLELLQDLLWFDRLPALAPPAPDLKERRERFMTLVRQLCRATATYNERLRRVTLGPE